MSGRRVRKAKNRAADLERERIGGGDRTERAEEIERFVGREGKGKAE